MDASVLVNGLAGLMVVSSLLVILAKSMTVTIRFYVLQSSLLVLTFLGLAAFHNVHELYVWAASAFVTKVILTPAFLVWAFKSFPDKTDLSSALSPAMLIVIAAAIVALSCRTTYSVQIPTVSSLKPALGVSLSLFLIGLLCIVSQRNILKQIFGFCLMENGAHLTLALMAHKTSEIIEVGIATDAIFAVIIMTLLARKIFRTLHTLDASELTTLKG